MFVVYVICVYDIYNSIIHGMDRKLKKWHDQKFILRSKNSEPPMVNEGEVWWMAVGYNIGSEVYGKGSRFTRPCVIFEKLSNKKFLAVPLTTKPKTGTWFVSFIFQNNHSVACLAEVRSVDHRRLIEKIGQLSPKDMKKVKDGLRNLIL